MTRDVFLHDAALCCSLGDDLASCRRALHAPAQTPRSIRIERLAEPIECRYYRIDDAAELLDPNRLEQLLAPVVQAATRSLSPARRAALPVFIGSSCFSIASAEAAYADQLGREADKAIAMPQPNYDGIADTARRVSGSRGPGFTWNTACTASANALLGAQRMLALGEFEQALVLGVELANLTSLAGFSSLQLLADRVRPFADERRGVVLGEAISGVLLSTTPNTPAREDGCLRLCGGAADCDSYSITTANPDGAALAALQRQALAAAGATPGAVRAIKAHATGTPANDAGEARSLHALHDNLPPVVTFKQRIGHSLGACGVVELALLSGALHEGFLPASGTSDEPGSDLDVQPLDHEQAAPPGLYQLNQFGFGGNHTVLVVDKP